MALWWVPGTGLVDDSEEGASIPEPGELQLPNGEKITWGIEGTQKLPSYRNTAQFGDTEFQWDPTRQAWTGTMPETAPGYVTGLLDLRDRLRAGTAQPWEQAQYQQWEQQARAIPTRDIGSLTAGWQGQYGGQWGEGGWQEGNADWWTSLDPGSPDVGGIMLSLRDTLDAGTASAQERVLYDKVLGMARDWNYRASVPQASDRFSLLGDNLLSALAVLGVGATGGLAAAPLAAGGASLATTLGSLGTLSGIAGTGAGVLGGATDQGWLQKLGLGLGIAGGLAGGVGGLAHLWGTGVSSLSDAAKLASNVGKVTGALGRIPGADPLKQASSYLGLAGTLGQGASGVQGLLGAAQGVSEGATQALSPQDLVTPRGGDMADFSYEDFVGWGDPYGPGTGAYVSPEEYGVSPDAYASFTGWGDPYGPGSSGDVGFSGDMSGSGGGNWLSTLGGLAGGLGKFLGANASWLGPAAGGLTSLLGGARGAQASTDAAGLQAAALNRGLDLQTAQWLQQQANQAPWLHAGQQALPQLASLAGQGPQAPFQPPGILRSRDYGLPSQALTWGVQSYQGPQAVQAGDYRWTPGQGPRAADYRYTPGQTPNAGDYRYTPGSAPRAADYRYTPGAVPTLSGQELLANDPGVAFRLQEGRNALEASAAARGGALSGPALAALQRQGQDLSSQEYGNAWQRAAQQAQMREGWNQYATQQGFGQSMAEAQAREQWAQQASQMGFGQALSATQLREQLQQYATQQGWSQAQTEAAFREQMAQQATAQNWGQALQGQQTAWQQGLTAQQWEQQQRQQSDEQAYQRAMGQNQLTYGRDWQANQAAYERMLAQYNAQTQNQNTQWNRYAALSGLGQTSADQLGKYGYANTTQMGSLLSQLGAAQGLGTLGSAYNTNQGWGGATTAFSNLLKGLNA